MMFVVHIILTAPQCEDQPSKESLSLSHLINEGVLAVHAGAGTASSALTSIFSYLLCNLETYKRLQEEVDRF
ncbi:hypothetical protein C8Q79DRAFT_990056 [Trametes meyenii]|nr:hypothetical protein C8Q79DRAFT_990056 [Trametes meyenii]